MKWVHSLALLQNEWNLVATYHTRLFCRWGGCSVLLLCNHPYTIPTTFRLYPPPSLVCAHHFMYIMSLFSGLLEDLCSFVLNQKSNLYVVKFVHLSRFCFCCCCIIIHPKNILFQSSLNYCNGNFFPLLYLFLLSVSDFWITEKIENCKLWHYLYCTWLFSYIFIAFQRVLHLIRGYKVF